MLSWAELGATVERAVAEMQRQGVGVTPRRVEQVANAVEAARSPEPHAGNLVPASEIAAAWLTPKAPDGSGGELLGALVAEGAGNAGRPQFAEPVPYAAARTERERLTEQARGLRVEIDRPQTPEHVREDARRKLAEIDKRLDEIRGERQPETRLDRSGARTG